MVIHTPSKPSSQPPIIALAGGGTGGHLFPALAIADALHQRVPDMRLLFFSTQRRIDGRILGSAPCELVRQTLQALSPKPWRWPGIALTLHRSCRLCRARLERDRPVVVIGTGGLGSVPAVHEAIRAGIPTVLLNPDALVGRANRLMAQRADVVFAQWEETVDQLGSRAAVRVTGCAVRPEFNRSDRSTGHSRFGLDPERKTLLVTGASQGARTINEAVLANVALFETLPGWQILHLTGELDCARVREAYRRHSVHAKVIAFTEHMADALGAADLVIARAGASTLAEITAVGRAAVLMPYPFHRDMHQRANARCLVRASAGRILEDRIDPTLNGPALGAVLGQLMRDDDLRARMALAAHRLGRGQAAKQIADQIFALAAERGTLTHGFATEGAPCTTNT